MSWFKRLKEQSAEIPDGIKQLNEYNRILEKLTAEQRAEIREKVFTYWLAMEWRVFDKRRTIENYLNGYLNALVDAGAIASEEKSMMIGFIRRCRNLEVEWNWCDSEKDDGKEGS